MVLFIEFFALNETNQETRPEMRKPVTHVLATSGGIALLAAYCVESESTGRARGVHQR